MKMRKRLAPFSADCCGSETSIRVDRGFRPLRLLLSGSIIAMSAYLFPVTVSAQTDAAEERLDDEASGARQLDTVFVTARKREESLQDTPISIKAFSGPELESRGIDNLASIGQYTPNMTFDKAATIGGSNNSAIVYIRGIGQDAAVPTIDLGVGTYVDGVYFARSVGGALDLVDVEGIEVLRGPQGTLFGRNTIGGAVNITTRKPSADFDGNLAATYGSDELIILRGGLNGALSDNLYAKGAFMYKTRDGYVIRADGVDMGNDDMFAGTAALRWEPTEKLTVDLSFDATTSDTNGAPFVLKGLDTSAEFVGAYNAALVPPSEGCFVPPPMGTGVTNSTNPLCYNGQYVPTSEDTDFGTLPPKDELDVWGVAGTIEYELTPNLTVKSITSYRDADSAFNLDQDHSPLTVFHLETDTTQEQFTQEIQLLGDSLEGSFNWILGAYYFEEEVTYLENIVFPPLDFQSGGLVDNDSWALFAQATYDLTEKLSVTGGLRYTEDNKRFTPDSFIIAARAPGLPPPGFPVLPPVEASTSTEEVDPMISLGYQWNDALLTYVTYSEGFKSGGFTQRVFPPLPETPSFDPEFVNVYEAGFKWEGFDNRARINGAYFFSDYEDLQIVTQSVSIAPLVQNAGGAEIQGFELDFEAVPGDNWLIKGGLGYLDGEYTEIDPGTGVGLGNELVKAPEWTGTLAVSYDWDLGGSGTITPLLDYTYRDSYQSNAINSPLTEQDAFSLINIGVTYVSEDENWMISAVGQNLTDERFISAGYSEQNGPTSNIGITEVIRDRGQQWMITVKRSFN